MNYHDIKSYGNSAEILAERNQRNIEEDYQREREYATGEKIRPGNSEMSKLDKEIAKKLCKDMFKYTPEEVEAMYARC